MIDRDLNTWTSFSFPVWRIHVAALLLLVGMATCLYGSAQENSPTADEPMHLVRGLAIWWEGDTHHSYAHPPLANLWAAAPAAWFFEETDLTKLPGWKSGDTAKLAKAYMAADYEKARAQLVMARLSIALLTLLFAAYVYNYSRRRFGPIFGLCALCMVAFHPAVLAHGSLVTTDMALTVWLVVACAELVSNIETPRAFGVARAALVFSFSLVTKHSAALLAPLLVAFVLGAAGWQVGCYAARPRRVRCWIAIRHVLLSAAIAVFVVNLSFGFDRTFMSVDELLQEPEPKNWITRGYRGQMLERGVLGQLPEGLRLPIPYTYLVGLASVQAHNARGHRSWFIGEVGHTGWASYFPTLVVIKSPACVFLFLIFGSWLVWRRGAVAPPVFFFAAVSLYLLLLIVPARLNIGVRHALPVMVFWSVLAGWGAAACLRFGATKLRLPNGGPVVRRWAQLFVAGILFGLVLPGISVVRAYPYFIGHFNELVGPRLGHQISMIGEDWGQDDGAFADFVQEQKLQPLYFQRSAFTGIHEVKRKKVSFRRLRCPKRPRQDAWVAIHASNYLRTRERCFAWLGDREPDKIFRDHIYLFRYEPTQNETK